MKQSIIALAMMLLGLCVFGSASVQRLDERGYPISTSTEATQTNAGVPVLRFSPRGSSAKLMTATAAPRAKSLTATSVAVPAKRVLLWQPTGYLHDSSRNIINNLCGAYEVQIPSKSCFKSKYKDGIAVDVAAYDGTTASESTAVDLPASLDEYALVFVIYPSNMVTPDQVAKLKSVVARGGRVVLQGENGGATKAQNAVLSQLAKDMGADFVITGDACGGGDNPYKDDYESFNRKSDLLKEDLADGMYPISICVAPIVYSGIAQEVARVYANRGTKSAVWAVDEASGNGRITAFSDINWFENYSSSRNALDTSISFLERLLDNAIENEKKVIDEENPNEDIEEKIPDWAVAAVRDKNNFLTYYSNVVSACTAASQGLAVLNRLTVVLKRNVSESFTLPEGVTFETTDITTNYTGTISVPTQCRLVVNATHDVYKSVRVYPPETPTVTASKGWYSDRVQVIWSEPNSKEPITAYELVRVKVGSTLETVLSSTITGTSYSDTSARSGIHYIYYVRAQSSAGWGFAGSDEGWRSANGQVPDPVLEVTATAGTETNGVIVTWQPDTNSAISVTHYEVSRAPKGTDDWTTLTSTVDPSETSFTDTTAKGGVEYDYQVRAGNDSGWSEGVRSDGAGWRVPSLSVSPTLVELGPGPDDADIAVSANGAWSYVPDDEWLSGERISGGLRISAQENPEFAMRTGTVYVIVGSAGHAISNAVLVVQAARPLRPMTLTVDGPDTLVVGTTNAYVATVTYNDGSTVNKSIEAVWSAAPDGFAASVVKGDTNVTLKVGAAVSGSLTLRAEYSETCAAAGGLVAWYRLDGNGKDSSVYGNHAVEHGVVPTTDHNGKANGAYYFNGSTYLEAPDHYALYSVSNVISVCAWMKPSSMSGWQYALCKSTVHEIRQYGLGVNGNRFYINDGEASVYRPYGDLGPLWTDVSKTLVAGEWHHVMVTYDGNAVKAYLDAELVGSKTVTGYFHDAPGGLLLGYDPPGEIEYYTGALDDVRIYNRALSADQVAVVCAGGTVADSGTETVTVAGTKTVTVALPPVPGTPVVSATDGSQTNQVSVSWTVPSSTCPITAYEVSRQQKGTSGWTVLTNGLTSTNYVDTTAAPGENYIYRVRAQNIGGWGGYGSDAGWQAIALSLDPTAWSPSYGATNLAVSVMSNTGWAVADSEGAATVTTGAGGLNVALPANTTLSDRSGSVTVTAGGSTDHPVSKTFTYTQSKRPPKLTGLEIVGGSSSVEGGASTNFQVIAIFDDGTTNDVTSVATWSVDHPEYGGISAGRLTTHETTDTNRSVRVSVTYEYTTYDPTTLTATEDVGISFTTRLKRPVSIAISGPETVRIAETGSYTATVRYNNGDEADVTVSTNAVWEAQPSCPAADLVKGKASWRLTPYVGGTNVILVLLYDEVCGKKSSGTEKVTVGTELTVKVPATIPLPIAVDAESMAFATGGNTNGVAWYGQAKQSHDGIDAAQSGRIFGAGESWMKTVVTNAGDVSFWWKTSCEPTYDNLSFAIDGVVQSQTSGTTNDWRQLRFEIPGGAHTLSWTYAKDGKNDVGQDCGWVDQLVWDPLPAPSAPTGGVTGAAIRASDGTSADYIEVEWSPFDSRRPILGYELSRAKKDSDDWTVLSTNGVLRYVDMAADPGVDYTYRVRARNDGGWGEYVSDDGWRAYSLSVGATDVELGCGATTNDMPVDANAEWAIAVGGDSWLKAGKASETNAVLAVEERDSIDARTNSVTVSVGGTSPHATNVTVTVVQSGRPPKIDVGFVKPYEDWRTRLQITTNLTDDAYAPVSVFTVADALDIGFGWTNRSEVAIAPSVRFRLYAPDADAPVAEWTVEGRADEALHSGQGAWSGGWPFEPLPVLKPGDYRLEAELGPELNDINREGDLDSDKSDNVAIFRFAVRDPALDAFRDVFAEFDFTNVEFKVGNDYAQAPHVASIGEYGPSIQFGPYVPMNGKNGREVRGKAPLDLIFLIDVTGSMWGCIDGLKTNIREFFKTLVEGDKDHAPITDWRAKVIGYRDVTCDYSWYEDHGFTTDVGAFNSHIASCVATGGGDTPESLLDAVWRISKETQFREDASRAIVAFTDASCKKVMSYGDAAGGDYAKAAQAIADAGVVLHVVSSDYGYSWDDGLNSSELVAKVNEVTGGTNSTYKYVGSLSTTSLNAGMLSGLAKTVSSGVKETKVIEPQLSCSTRGYGTLSFDWKNDAIDGTNNTFAFECASVTNISNKAGSGWQHVELELKEGWHLFQWTYGKRDYRGAVSDCGIVANLAWEPYATKLDIQPATLPADYTGLALPPYNVTVTNFDGRVVTSNDYCVAYSNREDQVDSVGTVTNTIITYGGKFKVDCNSCWKVVEADDWLKPISGEGDGNGELIVEIAENTNYAQRTGFITVRAGEYGLPADEIVEKTVKVVQDPHPYVEDGKVHILTVDVKPRWPWNDVIDIDFRVITPEKTGTPVKITFYGVNNEGGEMLDYYPALKAAREVMPRSEKLTNTHGLSGGTGYVNCPTSGFYRVTWNDMAESWYQSYSSIGSYAGWKKNGFHSPAFSVRLKAECSGKATVELPSRPIRVDMRQNAVSASSRNSPTEHSGGSILTGTEMIGHPTGKVDPVAFDTTDRTLFLSNGWNKLDAIVEDLGSDLYSNRFDRACVINDAYIEGGLILSNTIWRADKVHVVRDNVFVHKDATLTIEDGAVVKFCFNTYLFIYKDPKGSGMEEFNIRMKGCYLTCGFDDSYGGNTLYYNAKGVSGDTTEKWNGLSYIPVLSNATSGNDFLPQVSSSDVRAATRVSLQCKVNGKWTSWKDRFYSRGQCWGNLPRPSETGMEFFGWYCNDPENWLTTEILASKYPASKAFMIPADGTPFEEYTFGKGTTMTKVTKHFRDGQIFALICSEGWTDTLWDPIDARGGKIVLSEESATYDGKEHKPGVVGLMIFDSNIDSSMYVPNYDSGDFTSVGKYAVGVDILSDDYVNSPTNCFFTIEPRSIEGGEILFSDPTNGVMYLPGRTKKPTVTVHLPEYKGSAIDDAVATADAVISDLKSTDPTDHVWPEVGEYRVVASYVGNPNYTGGALTNFFRVSVNPDYVFTKDLYDTLEEAEDPQNVKKVTDKGKTSTPRIIRFSGRESDILLNGWKDMISGNTKLNDYVCEHFVCWADTTDGAPSIGVRSLADDQRDIVTTNGVLTVTDILAFFESAFAAPELPVDASGATLTFVGESTFEYDGKGHQPSVTVSLGDVTIPYGNYELVYSGEGVDVGTYSVYAKFNGETFMGETVAELYKVVPKALTASDVSVDPASAAYDGRMHKPTVSTGVVTCLPPDYGTGDFAAVGDYPITVTACGNYTGTVTKVFRILPREIDEDTVLIELDAVTAEVKKSKSGGDDAVDVCPHLLSVSDGTRTYVEGVDYDLSYSPSSEFTEPGTYTITVTFKGGYSGSASVEFTVTEAVETDEEETVTIEGDGKAFVEKTAEGITIRPSEGVKSVTVNIPTGVDETTVTVEISSAVESVKPNGATIRIIGCDGKTDITSLLHLPEPVSGVVDLTKATVIDEVVSETLNPDVDGTIIELKDPKNPELQTVTREGLFYQLFEGRGLGTMTGGDSTIGNGKTWAPKISVKGGNSAFYRIGVAPHEE